MQVSTSIGKVFYALELHDLFNNVATSKNRDMHLVGCET